MAKKRKKKFFNKKGNSIKIFILVLLSIGSLLLGYNIKKIIPIISNSSSNMVVENNLFDKSKSVLEKIKIKDDVEKNSFNEENTETKYKVIGISDGDTVTVKKIVNNKLVGDSFRIRMFGIDAPEKDQDYGIESMKALSNYVKDKEITVDIKSKDRYGRIVGVIYLDNRNINQEMLRDGHVWYYEVYDPKNEKSKILQENAKKNKLGLFSRKNYIEPWKYRKDKQNR